MPRDLRYVAGMPKKTRKDMTSVTPSRDAPAVPLPNLPPRPPNRSWPPGGIGGGTCRFPEAATESPDLRDEVQGRCENRPGVYWMTSPNGEVLYVGKSVRVRSRLLSYFQPGAEAKAAEIARKAGRIHWRFLPDEFAALLTELRMIRRWAPRFNVRHAGGRGPAFIRLTREPAPRVLATTRARRDGSMYFGPFPAPARLTRTLRDLTHATGLRDCAATTPIHFRDQLDLLRPSRRALCYRGEIGSCPAPCAAGCTEEEYAARIRETRAFLEGETDEPLLRIQEAMASATHRLQFEHAARLRDRAARLRDLRDHLREFRGEREGLCFLYRIPGHDAPDHAYVIRGGRVRLQMPEPRGAREEARFRRAVTEAAAEPEAPPEDLGIEESDEIVLVARWFRLRPEEWERTEALEPLTGGTPGGATPPGTWPG